MQGTWATFGPLRYCEQPGGQPKSSELQLNNYFWIFATRYASIWHFNVKIGTPRLFHLNFGPPSFLYQILAHLLKRLVTHDSKDTNRHFIQLFTSDFIVLFNNKNCIKLLYVHQLYYFIQVNLNSLSKAYFNSLNRFFSLKIWLI